VKLWFDFQNAPPICKVFEGPTDYRKYKVGFPQTATFAIVPKYYSQPSLIFIFSCWQAKGGFNAPKNASFGYLMQTL